VSRWGAFWRTLTKNRRSTVTAIVVLIALVAMAERVMAHGYHLGAQWGPDKRFELTPPSIFPGHG
jgi:hypothetical protein